MLLRGTKLTIVGTGMLLAMSAYAQGPKFGFEYRAGLTYDDGKLKEKDGSDAQSSTNIALESANIVAEGEAAKNVSYVFGYDLLSSELYEGHVDMKFNDMMAFYAGRGKVAQGGWHHKDHYKEYNNVETAAAFGYSMVAPLDTFSDSLGVKLNLAGTLSLNAFNDIHQEDTDGNGTVDSNVGAKNKSEKSQAYTIEWAGNFGGWMPLVQLMMYDLNKSTAVSVGVKGNVAGLGLLANYTTDSRYNGSTGSDKKDVYSQIDLHVGYALSGFTPWLGFHKFDVKQDGKDLEINSAHGAFDDNAQQISLGVDCTAMGNGYVPYLSINMVSGDYDKDGVATTTGDETKSGMIVKAGVMGKF